MGKYGSVFFLSIGKPKHPSHIKLKLFKIRIQTIAADCRIIQILVGAFTNLTYLVICCRSTHNGKYLTGQHHPDAVFGNALNRIFMIIIIAVKPAFPGFSLNPFPLADMLHQPVGLMGQIIDQAVG